MFESMKVANLLQKHESRNPQAGWEEVFQMAFKNNRDIASRFFDETLGVLQAGTPADIIVVNYYPPTPITSENAYFHILFGISGDMVDTTIVGGKILLEDRGISGLDYERITRRVREQAEDFWTRF